MLRQLNDCDFPDKLGKDSKIMAIIVQNVNHKEDYLKKN